MASLAGEGPHEVRPAVGSRRDADRRRGHDLLLVQGVQGDEPADQAACGEAQGARVSATDSSCEKWAGQGRTERVLSPPKAPDARGRLGLEQGQGGVECLRERPEGRSALLAPRLADKQQSGLAPLAKG